MNNDRTDKVALLAPPWPTYKRPSIQLGTLKAYLKQTVPDLGVDAFHLYLPIAAGIGYLRYAKISERTWLAETIFAALLYPEKMDTAQALFRREAGRHAAAVDLDFEQLVKTAGVLADRFIAGIDWNTYLLAGITISLCQLTAGLYLAREIKRKSPDIRIVVGGAGVAGASGRAIGRIFQWIDAVVQGEGEKPLADLVRSLRSGGEPTTAGSPAILADGDPEAGACSRFDQFESLAALPVPDYSDYFKQLGRLIPEKRFFPVLPVEVSRGCWWQRKLSKGGRGCAFCNLNTQWHGYRAKAPSRVIQEINSLKKRYQLLDFAFMDNALPVKTSREIFKALADTSDDFSFFGEIRATTRRETLAAMRSAGLDRVQVGVEALSSRMLKKLNKGISAIENLALMKHCEELGIESRSNLILEFPGSDAADVSETLRAIEFAAIYRPLKPVRFWLGLGSPVCSEYKAFGIQSHFNHPNYRALFPREICRQVPFVIRAYRGDRGRQKKLWKPVRLRIRQWEASYAALQRRDPAVPILSYRDGGDFIVVRRKETGRRTGHHRLAGASRKLYLFCRQPQLFESITRRHPGFTPTQIKDFLDEMVGKQLMFTETGRYLSLAVRVT